MIYGDNQTRHFYVVAGSAGVAKKELAGTDKFRLMIHQGGNDASTASNVTATTDVFDKKLIKDVRVSTPKAYAPREWNIYVTDGSSACTALNNTEYKLYFYADNVMGFGIMDRVDRVATYTTSSTSDDALYIGLAKDLYNKIGIAGLLKDDFEVGIKQSTTFVNAKDFTSSTNTATCLTIREKTVNMTEMDILTHYYPYQTNVIISGSCGNNDNEWIAATNAATTAQRYANAGTVSGTYHNGVNVYDMEHYFMRNRGDLYDVNPDFYTSIKNAQYVSMSGDYACVDVHYAFSDDLGFTYHSDKDFTIVTTGTASNIDDIAASTDYVPGDVIKYNAKYWLVTKPFTSAAVSPSVTTDNAKDLGTDVALADAYQIAALFK